MEGGECARRWYSRHSKVARGWSGAQASRLKTLDDTPCGHGWVTVGPSQESIPFKSPPPLPPDTLPTPTTAHQLGTSDEASTPPPSPPRGARHEFARDARRSERPAPRGPPCARTSPEDGPQGRCQWRCVRRQGRHHPGDHRSTARGHSHVPLQGEARRAAPSESCQLALRDRHIDCHRGEVRPRSCREGCGTGPVGGEMRPFPRTLCLAGIPLYCGGAQEGQRWHRQALRRAEADADDSR